MSFTSNIENMLVIDNSNYREYIDFSVNGTKMGRGLKPRDFSKVPRGAVPYSAKFKLPSWSRAEIKERIEGAEKTKSRLTDHCDLYKLGVKNQSFTNYCVFYSVTHCVEIIRSLQRYPYVELAPESIGGPITGYKNVGNWGVNAIEYAGTYGIVPRSMWPAWQINSKYMTEAAKEERKKYKISEVWELEYKNFEQLCICLLLGFPVSIGLDWWGHQVTCMNPVILKNGGLGVVIDNSWGKNWSDNGRGILTEDKALGDMFAPRVVI